MTGVGATLSKLSNLCRPIQCVAYREEQTAIVGIFKNVSIIYRVCKPQYEAISRDTPKKPTTARK